MEVMVVNKVLSLHSLNKDCFLLIAELLDIFSRRNLSQTCQKFRNLIKSGESSSLDTRPYRPVVSVFPRDNNSIVVNRHRPFRSRYGNIYRGTDPIPQQPHTSLYLEDDPSKQFDRLPEATTGREPSTSMFYNSDWSLKTDVNILSQDELLSYFEEMNQFWNVLKIRLDFYIDRPKPQIWLLEMFKDTFRGVEQIHYRYDLPPTDFSDILDFYIQRWDIKTSVRFMWFKKSEETVAQKIENLLEVLKELVVKGERQISIEYEQHDGSSDKFAELRTVYDEGKQKKVVLSVKLISLSPPK